jgi:adenylate kinase
MTEWRCKDGLTNENIRTIVNAEFNKFRGLFPLKLVVLGPPGSGKTFFCAKLAAEYGIPHITVKDCIEMGVALQDEFGEEIREKIEEIKT